MKNLYRKGSVMFFISAFAIASIMLTVAGESEKAVAQSPMDTMNMMMSRGGNMTDGGMMMGLDGNMSMPFNMGVLVMPTMCTTPGQLLGSLTGMMGGGGMAGEGGNATQQMMMGLMQKQMMSEGGFGMGNTTEAEMQHIMNMSICLPVMDEEMMKGMMGNGQNNMSSMMGGMMMQ
jgi:hypothetical protein